MDRHERYVVEPYGPKGKIIRTSAEVAIADLEIAVRCMDDAVHAAKNRAYAARMTMPGPDAEPEYRKHWEEAKQIEEAMTRLQEAINAA